MTTPVHSLAVRSLLKSSGLPRLRTHVSVHGRFTGKTGRGTLVSGADDGGRARVNSIARIPGRITPPETTQRRLEAVRATAIDSTLLSTCHSVIVPMKFMAACRLYW